MTIPLWVAVVVGVMIAAGLVMVLIRMLLARTLLDRVVALDSVLTMIVCGTCRSSRELMNESLPSSSGPTRSCGIHHGVGRSLTLHMGPRQCTIGKPSPCCCTHFACGCSAAVKPCHCAF